MRAIFLFVVLLLAAVSVFAEVTMKYDQKNDCELYRAVSKRNVGGEWEFVPELESGETVHKRVSLFGMSVSDLEIDFEKRLAKGFLEMRIPLHRNKNLVSSKVKISSKNKGFTDFINRTNTEINMIYEVCLDRNHNVVYFK